MIWVQQVDILYTKASRGAPAATARNRLPRAFAMHVHGEDVFSFEYYRLLEWKRFTATIEKTGCANSPPGRYNDLAIRLVGKALLLGLRWNSSIGQPPRRDAIDAVELQEGMTAKLIINGRFTSYSGQYYTEATYNVAYGDDLSPDVFAGHAPNALLDMRADLF